MKNNNKYGKNNINPTVFLFFELFDPFLYQLPALSLAYWKFHMKNYHPHSIPIPRQLSFEIFSNSLSIRDQRVRKSMSIGLIRSCLEILGQKRIPIDQYSRLDEKWGIVCLFSMCRSEIWLFKVEKHQYTN